jgi:D-alanyl-D-alanine endopeptidase (penicillin-binding protein 7)
MMQLFQANRASRPLCTWLRTLGACALLAALAPARAEAASAAKSAAPKRDNPKAGSKRPKVSNKTGKKTSSRMVRASRPPRHHHSEKHVPAMKGKLPNVQSLGALVVDLDTGQEIFAHKPDQPRSIASISKLAAALTVMDRKLELDGLTTIKHVDAEVARGGARSRLLEGMTLSNRDLLHAALLGSDNRAISALGRAVGLSTTPFTAAMNRKVASLGLRHTRFREPTGLSADNQSTPRETIELLKAAMAHPVLGPVVSRPEYDAHPVSKPPIHYVNTDRPAARANLQILGGKTGYNDSARYCLVIAVKIDGHNYGMSLLATEGDLTRFGDVARIADWIVVHKPKRSPSSAPQGPPPPETILGSPPAHDGGTSDVPALLGAN